MSVLGEYSVETPENVEVSFELAGPGSRFCAMVIDLLLLWLIVFVLGIFAALAGVVIASPIEGDAETFGRPWVMALVIVGVVVALFGYFTIFEWGMRGQTPGKRTLRIRVIRDDGTPAGPLDIVIRNLVRIVDALPGFYVVGGLAALLDANNRRLGDLAAGTIVVKEAEPDYHAQADKKKPLPLPETPIAYAALSAEERRLVRGFLQRRLELLPDARSRLAESLAARLHARHGGDMSDAEAYLERLAEGRHFEP